MWMNHLFTVKKYYGVSSLFHTGTEVSNKPHMCTRPTFHVFRWSWVIVARKEDFNDMYVNIFR